MIAAPLSRVVDVRFSTVLGNTLRRSISFKLRLTMELRTMGPAQEHSKMRVLGQGDVIFH
jgi:hypothetical protein